MEETTLSGRLPFESPVYAKKSRPRKSIKKELISEIITYFFILLFVFAGLRKLIDLEMFIKEVYGFALFGSHSAIRTEFATLSTFELITALLLTLPKTRVLGWYATFVHLFFINIAMFYMQQFAKIIPIYYGGIIPGAPFIVHFIFNLATLFAALLGLLLMIDSRSKKAEGH
jgi:hypothetical protein